MVKKLILVGIKTLLANQISILTFDDNEKANEYKKKVLTDKTMDQIKLIDLALKELDVKSPVFDYDEIKAIEDVMNTFPSEEAKIFEKILEKMKKSE